jgi:hypothetical protein
LLPSQRYRRRVPQARRRSPEVHMIPPITVLTLFVMFAAMVWAIIEA